MTDKKPKTIGLSYETWKRLKHFTTEQDCSMSEAVDMLLEEFKRRGAVPRTSAGAAG